jgi:YD repeat-containing protein
VRLTGHRLPPTPGQQRDEGGRLLGERDEVRYIYDADGNLLVEEDPSSVIYYGDGGAEELVLTTAGAVSSALRFYG